MCTTRSSERRHTDADADVDAYPGSMGRHRRMRRQRAPVLLLLLVVVLLVMAAVSVGAVESAGASTGVERSGTNHPFAHENAHGLPIVALEMRGEDGRITQETRTLDELEMQARAEERDAIQKKLSKTHALEPPAVESLLADFDHDGQVGTNEIKQIKENLHHIFDADASGSIDTKEIQKMVTNERDVASAFQKLDRDHDSVISLQELDERWEAVGAEMTVGEVADWVAFSVQLPQYSDLFRQHSISGYTFPLLMQNDGARLQEIGVDQDIHRQQLAMFFRKKYLGMGRKPHPVAKSECELETTTMAMNVGPSSVLAISWVPFEDVPQRFQLQRRSPGAALWTTVYTGSDLEFMDVVPADQHVIYRLTTWNAYGRSPHTFVRCNRSTAQGGDGRDGLTRMDSGLASVATTQPALTADSGPMSKSSSSASSVQSSDTDGKNAPPDKAMIMSLKRDDESNGGVMAWLKSYLWWLDEAIALTFFIVLPIRGLIYGDADYILRLLRRLPPNMPTRVSVEAVASKATLEDAAVIVSWEKPIPNGVPIVCYCVRWTRLRKEEVKWIKLLTLPLPTNVTVEHVRHGETYKFVVEATNAFGLVTQSSQSTYMVPVPELHGKLRPQRSIKDPVILRNRCYICQDPDERKRVPFSATLDRHILHFCYRCDREFCHFHKGSVFHTKALSCPAVDGRCLCRSCKKRLVARGILSSTNSKEIK